MSKINLQKAIFGVVDAMSLTRAKLADGHNALITNPEPKKADPYVSLGLDELAYIQEKAIEQLSYFMELTEQTDKALQNFASSSNGRTTDFDSVNVGSSPAEATINIKEKSS